MITRTILRKGFFATLFVGLMLAHGTAFSNSDRIISNVGFILDTDTTKIDVHFHFPVKYLRHYPLKNGTEVRIQFEPIIISGQDAMDLNDREVFYPSTHNPAGVIRIEYEGDSLQQPSILVVFDRSHHFDASQGNDFRSLAIHLQTEAVPAEKEKSGTSELKLSEGPNADETLTTLEAPPAQPRSARGLSAKQEQDLLKEGADVMAENNYSRAVQVYTRLLDSVKPEVLETAQFQLALAQERIGHLAHARAEYKNYLMQFPDGGNADEARHRLDNLLRDRPVLSDDGSPTSGTGELPWEKDFFGNVSLTYDRDESYYRDEIDNGEDETVTNVNALTAGIDATLRLRSDRHTVEGVAVGSVENNFVSDRPDRTRIYALYLDFEDNDETLGIRLGRQRSSKGGVLGRFDGARFGYGFMDKARLNLVAGFPVDRSYDGFESDRYFYGLNFDLGTFAGHWNVTPYLIDQRNEGFHDRQAVGTEIRYLGNRGSFFTLADYDLLYNDLGILLFTGNQLLPDDRTRINLSMDFRKSPILTTGNALIGQTAPSLEELVDTIGEAAVRDLAMDRSLSSSYITIGLTRPMTDKLQIATDVSWSKISGMPASGGVEGYESSGDEYYLSLQLIGESLFTTNDLSTLSLRYAQTRQRSNVTLLAGTRYPLTERWRISPKLQIGYRQNRLLSGDQLRFEPGLRIEYSPSRRWHFEIDGEYSYADKELEGLATERKGYSISLGSWSRF